MVATQRARAVLTKALRDTRRSAGLTGAALAEQLGHGWAQPKVSKLESGRQVPTEDDIRAWAHATGTDPAWLLGLQERANHEFSVFREAYQAEGGAERHQDSYGTAEQAASVIFGFSPIIIHGLLQTADYARALLRLPGGPADHGATADQIDRMVASRMRRGAALYEPGRQVTIILGEAALRNRVGTPEVMDAQVQHIARLLAGETHARIGILPFGSFPVIIQHGWDQRDKIISLETTAGDLEIADPIEIAQYERWSALIAESAVTHQAAVALCPIAGG